MKQTAVEWLVEELGFVEYEGLSQPEWIKNLIFQAKEMEKEQKDDAFNKGFNKGYYDPNFDNDED